MEPTTAPARDDPTEPTSHTPARRRPLALLRAMRPTQWSKNVLLAVPILTGHEWANPDKWLMLLPAFVSFCLAASSVYLVNDVLDAADDRNHPRKRRRPIAAGDVTAPTALIAAALLLAAAIGIGAMLPGWFVELLIAYLILTTSYSLYFKRKPVLDAIFLAGLYTHRIVIGGEATGLFPTPWLLAFGMFMFLSLAFAKRHAELTMIRDAGREPSAGRGYRLVDLPLLLIAGLASGYAGVMVFALYINSITGDPFYELPQLLWFICPLLIYWITRMWLMSNRGELHDDPLLFTLTDRLSWFVGACIVALVVVASG